MSKTESKGEEKKRFDVFRFPHIPFRCMLNEALRETGMVYFLDDQETEKAMSIVKDAIYTYKEHGNGEDEYFGKPLAEKDPKTAKEWAAQHANDKLLDAADAKVDEILKAKAADRGDLVDKLYDLLNKFIADNLPHMRYEETTIQAALEKHFTDEDLLGMQANLVKGSPQKYMQLCGGYFMRFHGMRGRIEFLGLLKNAPPFKPLLGLVKSLTSEKEYAYLCKELGVEEEKKEG